VIGFLAVAVVVIVAPGPDFALTVKNTVRGGGAATAFGVVTGQVVWVVATAAGVAALLAASHPAFVALRLVGAAYLVWLGLATLLARSGRVPRLRPGSPYRQGLLSNLANPKMPVFFISLLPQFGGSFLALTAHGMVFAALTLGWLTLVARGAALLLFPRVRRIVDVATGVVLVALGLRLATERR
jgi:threonine/homoserine/homoserine lactone efflux protein